MKNLSKINLYALGKDPAFYELPDYTPITTGRTTTADGEGYLYSALPKGWYTAEFLYDATAP